MGTIVAIAVVIAVTESRRRGQPVPWLRMLLFLPLVVLAGIIGWMLAASN
jgi:hypothetical protein